MSYVLLSCSSPTNINVGIQPWWLSGQSSSFAIFENSNPAGNHVQIPLGVNITIPFLGDHTAMGFDIGLPRWLLEKWTMIIYGHVYTSMLWVNYEEM